MGLGTELWSEDCDLAATAGLPRPERPDRLKIQPKHIIRPTDVVRKALTDCIYETTPAGSVSDPSETTETIFGRRTKNRAPLKLRP